MNNFIRTLCWAVFLTMLSNGGMASDSELSDEDDIVQRSGIASKKQDDSSIAAKKTSNIPNKQPTYIPKGLLDKFIPDIRKLIIGHLPLEGMLTLMRVSTVDCDNILEYIRVTRDNPVSREVEDAKKAFQQIPEFSTKTLAFCNRVEHFSSQVESLLAEGKLTHKQLSHGYLMLYLAMLSGEEKKKLGLIDSFIARTISVDDFPCMKIDRKVKNRLNEIGKGRSYYDGWTFGGSIWGGPHYSFIPPAIGLCESLPRLAFRHTKVSNLPEGVRLMKSLRNLEISNNSLTSIKPLKGMVDLKWLDLSNNKLTSLEGIETLRSLRRLNLGDNPLKVLPNTLCDLTQLEKLEVYSCHLLELPERLFKLTKLKDFTVTDNGVIGLPKGIGGLTCLEFLGLASTKIAELPEGITRLTSLAQLDLDGTRHLNKLPEKFTNLTALVNINSKYSGLPEDQKKISSELEDRNKKLSRRRK